MMPRFITRGMVWRVRCPQEKEGNDMTTLDISSEVTPEEYRRVLDSLLDQFEQWRREHGWCTDVYLYVAQLSRTFHWNKAGYRESIHRTGYTGAMELDISAERTPAGMAQDLREIRGRILRFTVERPDYITLEKADEFLTTAGLAPYQAVPRVSYQVSAGGRLASELTREQLTAKLEKYMRRLGVEHPEVYVAPARHPDRQLVTIPSSEMTELLTRPGRSF